MSEGSFVEAVAGSRRDGALPRHLQRLEAEAIAILREVAAEFRNPVMIYSIGKDLSVLLHLALKAFYPAKLPLPLLHVDTTWKFREMIAFRDATAERLGLELIVHTNQEGLARGIDPIKSGSALHTQVMKTEALKQALDRHGFDAAIGGARRDEEKSRAKERVFSVRSAGPCLEPAPPATRALAAVTTPGCGPGEIDAGVPVVELDRTRRVATTSRPSGSRSCRFISREAAAGRPARRGMDHGRRRPAAA